MPDTPKRRAIAQRRRAPKPGKPGVPDLRERTLPEILRRLALGEGLAAICKADGMPDRETVRRWCAADPAVAERIMQAREDGFFERAEQAVKDAKAAKDPQLGRLAFDAERWYLGKLSNAFAERPPKIDNQTNVQVNVNADNPFGRLVQFMDRAAAVIAGGASSTKLVAGDSEARPDSPAGGLDDMAPDGGSGLG